MRWPSSSILLLLSCTVSAEPATAVPATGTVAPWLTLEPGSPIGGFDRPLHATGAGDDSGRLFVVEQTGNVRVIKLQGKAGDRDRGKVADAPFLDVSRALGSTGGEQGLLGLAFHPAFKENRRLFIGFTDSDENDAYAELRADPTGAKVDAATLRVLFAIPDFASNHNGGHLAFAPKPPAGDGLLYLGSGDGGGGGDPQRTARDPKNLLGKMIVIDVDAPVLAGAKAGRMQPTWRYQGLRNPWRYAFDPVSGDLWIADVGQNLLEELHAVPAARVKDKLDFGWSLLEGTRCFRGACDPKGTELPVFEYKHGDAGCSITGGVVFRSAADAAEAQGTFVFADYCSGAVWIARRHSDAWQIARVLSNMGPVSSFGTDDDGGVWLVDHRGSVRRIRARAIPGATPAPPQPPSPPPPR